MAGKADGGLELKGIISMSTPLHWGVPPVPYRQDALDTYYPSSLTAPGSLGSSIEQSSVLSLLRKFIASKTDNGGACFVFPPMLALNGEWEPEDEIMSGFQWFVEEWKRLVTAPSAGKQGNGRVLETMVTRGHNHISPDVCLMSGEGGGLGIEISKGRVFAYGKLAQDHNFPYCSYKQFIHVLIYLGIIRRVDRSVPYKISQVYL